MYLTETIFVNLNKHRKKIKEHKTHFQELKKYCLQKPVWCNEILAKRKQLV